jgi:hypothetical protein
VLLNTDKELRVKFDVSPFARIAGNEIFEWLEPLNMREIRAKVIPWMEAQGYFRDDYVNDYTGWDDIAITRNGVEESLQHFSGPEKIQAFAALPEMLKNGILIRTRPSNKEGQRDMKEHIFAAKVDIGDKQKLVGFVVKEDSNGRRFYDHELTEMKNLDGLSPHAGAAGLNTGEADRTRQGSVINIIQETLKINNPKNKL